MNDQPETTSGGFGDVGFDYRDATGHGIDYRTTHYIPKQDISFSTASPTYPDKGLTVKQLTEAQQELCSYARWRIITTGADQYDQLTQQKFEDMDLHQIFKEARDEVADLINYLVFMDIRLQRMMKAVYSK